MDKKDANQQKTMQPQPVGVKPQPAVGVKPQPAVGVKPPVSIKPKIAVHMPNIMVYLILPWLFLKFWFWESPREIYEFFASLNHAFLELFSLPLMVKTFFKPLKNEYREGLIKFSRFMGMFLKSFIIIVDVLLFIMLLFVEFLVLLGFFSFPILTFSLFFL